MELTESEFKKSRMRSLSRHKHQVEYEAMMHRRRVWATPFALLAVAILGWYVIQPDPYTHWWVLIVAIALLVPYLASIDV